MKKFAVLVANPFPYLCPLFRTLAKHPKIDLTVYFCSNIEDDASLLKGYNYKLFKNYSPKPNPSTFFGLINTGIINELNKEKYDGILVFGYFSVTTWLAFFGSWLTKTPILFRGEVDLLKKESSTNKIIKKTIISGLFKTIRGFLYTYTLNKKYYQYYGVPEEKLFFHPCAVDNKFFQKKALELKKVKKKIKKTYGLPEKSIIILSAAQLIPRKRFMDLIKAYETLPKNLNASLVFIGDGSQKQELEKYVKRKNINQVYFVGFKEHSKLPEFYSIADIFVLPSEYDPSPKAMNEAMNFSLPIITTDKVGTGYDLVKNELNGFIYPVGDIKALSAHLTKLIKNPKLIKKMGEESIKLVSKWSLDEEVNGIIKAL